MSLPNYLAQIKSSGIYRFVWDKSQVPPQQAETMRLLVGYSEKGPFNAPVYVESVQDFISIFGNVSKRLERKGVYFHRLAQQALQAGPILALNLKKFEAEETNYLTFNPSQINSLGDGEGLNPKSTSIKTIFNTDRFWSIDPDTMVNKLNEKTRVTNYITIASTDIKDNSCSIFVRKYTPDSYKGIKVRSWYTSQGLEIPEWMDETINGGTNFLDTDISDYFAEVYVFRGQFSEDLYKADNSPLHKYFDVSTGYLNTKYSNPFNADEDALEALAKDSNSNFIGVYQGILFPNFKDANGNYISLDIKFNKDNTSHKMLMKLDESYLEESAFDLDSLISPNFEDDINQKPIYIPGYTYNTPTTATDIYQNCMNLTTGVLAELKEALTNRVDVEYHYLVDTFDSEPTNYKSEFFGLAKAKDNAFAIVNFPKISKFDNPGTNMKDAVSSFKTNIPTESDGASYGAYFTQLTFSDGTVKSIVPSAALVSNLFMDKWGARQPYYIVAGPTFGRLSYNGLIGPDFNFGRADLDVLEPMGVNAIVYVPRKGTYINSNQTAKQIPVSALSKIHIRELVIYLQNEIEYLLQSYQWELNTQTLRDTIKSKADAICETILNNGGLYAYKNTCDETNNTPEVIDNEMIILDTEIEPARGAGKMVHQLTIHKTGGLTSTVK